MTIILRKYQKDLKSEVLSAMKVYRHIIAELGCGGGKSYTFADIVLSAVTKGTKTLVLSHRLKILRQNNGAINDFGLKPIVLNDEDKNFDQSKMLYASSIQTIRARFDNLQDFIPSFGLIIIDECDSQDAVFLFESGLIDNIFTLGFTGTPYRSGGQRQLGIDWDAIVSVVTVPDLIKMGNVLPTRIFEVPFDPSSIKKTNGEFQAKAAFKAYDNPETYGGLLNAYKKHGEDRLFIGFCTTIKHCIKTCNIFNDSKIPCKFVISNLNKPKEPEDKEDLTAIEMYSDKLDTYNTVQKYKHLQIDADDAKIEMLQGKIKGVFSIDILSVGFDFQPLTVALINRATTSKRLWIQMSNRVTRVLDKPEFDGMFKQKKYGVIIDMGANRKRLCDVDQANTWSLWHETSDTIGLPVMKECPKCRRNVLASMKVCGFRDCGYRFPTKEELKKAELVEYLRDASLNNSEKTPEQLMAFAEIKGHSKNWVFRQLWIFNGDTKEFRDSMRKLGYENKFIYVLKTRFKKEEEKK